jgi:hypothetical protein
VRAKQKHNIEQKATRSVQVQSKTRTNQQNQRQTSMKKGKKIRVNCGVQMQDYIQKQVENLKEQRLETARTRRKSFKRLDSNSNWTDTVPVRPWSAALSS